MNINNIAMWVVVQQNNAGWDCFKTPILQQILRTQNPLLEEHGASSEVIHLFPISWMCKKQTSVSHSSTESEIISLDAGLRLDGIPALDLWDLIISVLGNTIQTPERPGRPVVGRDASHEPGNEQSMLNEVNIDFRIPGLPQNVVKQAQNSRVRELVKKIENHPHRHALQQDLRL